MLITLLLLSAAFAFPTPLSPAYETINQGSYKPSALKNRGGDAVTPYLLPLTRMSIGSDHLFARRSSSRRPLHPTAADLTTPSPFAGQIYSTEITFGSETFTAVVDTGSSDTWLVGTGYTCINGSNGSVVPDSSCRFGPAYNVSSTFYQVNDENFNITYGGDMYVNGIVGTEKVTLGGITVEQAVAVVNLTAFTGDGDSSGFIGLAYPNLTAVFAGTAPAADSLNNDRTYDPIFTTMYKQGLIPPIFSVALNRPGTPGPAGYLALGSLPPVPCSSDFVSTPILPSTNNPLGGPPYSTPQFQAYTIELEGVVYAPSSQNSTPSQPANFTSYNVNVDTGFSFTFLDPETTDAVAALFSPSATFDSNSGNYYVSCDATAPSVGVKIGGQIFYIDPADLVVQNGDENGDGRCVSGIQTFGHVPGVLGDPFLKNVVAVHDVGASEMRFAAREYY